MEALEEVRIWMLVPGRKDAYVPAYEGTFAEAMQEAAIHSALWKTMVQLYEVDPARFRVKGGLKHLWATVKTPKESPLYEEMQRRSEELGYRS